MVYKRCALNRNLSKKVGRYITIGHIGRIMGISRRSVYNKLYGKSDFSSDSINRLHKHFAHYDISKHQLEDWIRQSINEHSENQFDGASKGCP